MRLSTLFIIAATAAARPPKAADTASLTMADGTTPAGTEHHKGKKKKNISRMEKEKKKRKKKKKGESALLKLKDPLLGLSKEIEELTKDVEELEDETPKTPIDQGNASGGFTADDSTPPEAIEDTTTAVPPSRGDNNTVIPDTKSKSEQAVAGQPSKDCTKEICQLLLEPDYLLEYKVNVPEDTTVDECVGCSLWVRLTFDGTAWLAFALSTNGEMIGSEAIIGHPLMEGTEPGKYYLGGKYDGGIQPMEEEKQTLKNATILFEDGLSVLEFEKLMKEEGEIEISTGLNTFLWAHGEDNSLSTYHGNNRSPFQINLLGIQDDDVAENDDGGSEPTAGVESTLTSTDAPVEITSVDIDISLPPCPPAYDPQHTKYTAGSIVEVDNYIWQCREYPYDMYCNIPDFKPSLREENPNAHDLWLNAWSKSLGACTKSAESPTNPPSPKLSISPTTRPSTYSPSEIILTALPTASPMGVAIQVGLPFSRPELRFVQWKVLSSDNKVIAENLGYSRYSWNNLEVAEIERTPFQSLSDSEQQDVMKLGFNEETWDCFMVHYATYSWSELEDKGLSKHLTTLGWTGSGWESHSEVPESDDKSWGQLSKSEQVAAEKLCYTEKSWDWAPLPSW